MMQRKIEKLEETLDRMLATEVDLLAEARRTNKLLTQIRDALTEPVMRDAYFEKDR